MRYGTLPQVFATRPELGAGWRHDPCTTRPQRRHLDESITFYSTLFNTQPAKVKPGYANFAIAEPPLKLVLLENPGKGGTINHLGVEVDSSSRVHAEIARLTDAGMFTEEEIASTCCFATQDKVWVTGPGGEKWEVYTVLADSEEFGRMPQALARD